MFRTGRKSTLRRDEGPWARSALANWRSTKEPFRIPANPSRETHRRHRRPQRRAPGFYARRADGRIDAHLDRGDDVRSHVSAGHRAIGGRHRRREPCAHLVGPASLLARISLLHHRFDRTASNQARRSEPSDNRRRSSAGRLHVRAAVGSSGDTSTFNATATRSTYGSFTINQDGAHSFWQRQRSAAHQLGFQ